MQGGHVPVRRSLFNDRGFTLIEVMVAILIIVVAMFGLLTSLELATESNVKNQMRDEAILSAQTEMNHWCAMPFASISTVANPNIYRYAPQQVQSKLRGVTKNYNIVRSTIASPDGSVVDMGVRVVWTYKNISTAHEMHTVRGN
jgi:type IV pilus assembly protein PilV